MSLLVMSKNIRMCYPLKNKGLYYNESGPHIGNTNRKRSPSAQ